MAIWGIVNGSECSGLEEAVLACGISCDSFSAPCREMRQSEIIAVGASAGVTNADGADLGSLIETGRRLGAELIGGVTILVFGRLPPGATRDHFVPALMQKRSGDSAPIHVAHVVRHTDTKWLIGGVNDESAISAERALSTFGAVVRLPSCEASETASLLDNVFDAMADALTCELRSVLASLGWPLTHLLPSGRLRDCPDGDPGLRLLSWGMRRMGVGSVMVDSAVRIYRDRSRRIAGRIADALNLAGRPLLGSRIGLIGTSAGLIEELRHLLELRGAILDAYEPGSQVGEADALVILDVPEQGFKPLLWRGSPVIVDCCGAAGGMAAHLPITEA